MRVIEAAIVLYTVSAYKSLKGVVTTYTEPRVKMPIIAILLRLEICSLKI